MGRRCPNPPLSLALRPQGGAAFFLTVSRSNAMAVTVAPTRPGTSSYLDNEAVTRLQAAVRGDLIRPDDAAYETARMVYNGMIDRRPALIVRPVDAGDVVAAVGFARANDLPLS